MDESKYRLLQDCIDRLEAENKCKTKENDMMAKYVDNITADLEAANRELNQLRNQIQQPGPSFDDVVRLEQQLQAMTNRKEQYKAEVARLNFILQQQFAIRQAISVKLQQSQPLIEKLKEQNHRLMTAHHELEGLKAYSQQMKQQLENFQKNREEVLAQIDSLRLQYEEQKTEMMKTISEKVEDNESLLKENLEMKLDIHRLQEVIEKLTEEVNQKDKASQGGSDLAKQVILLEETLHQMTKKEELARTRSMQVVDGIKKREQQIGRLEKELDMAIGQREQLRKKLSNLEIQRQESRNSDDSKGQKSQDVKRLIQEYNRLSNCYNNLREQHEKQEDMVLQLTSINKALQMDKAQLQKRIAEIHNNTHTRKKSEQISTEVMQLNQTIDSLRKEVSSLISINLVMSNEINELRREKNEIQTRLNSERGSAKERSIIEDLVEDHGVPIPSTHIQQNDQKSPNFQKLQKQLKILRNQKEKLSDRVYELNEMNDYLMNKTADIPISISEFNDVSKSLNLELVEGPQIVECTSQKKGDVKQLLRHVKRRETQPNAMNMQAKIDSLKLQNQQLKKHLGLRP